MSQECGESDIGAALPSAMVLLLISITHYNTGYSTPISDSSRAGDHATNGRHIT